MDHPFVDPSNLTNEELQEKIQKCQSYLYGEIQCGHGKMVDAIRVQLDTYQFEFQERMATKRFEEFEKKNPSGTIDIGTIESVETPDPDADIDLKVKTVKYKKIAKELKAVLSDIEDDLVIYNKLDEPTRLRWLEKDPILKAFISLARKVKR